MIFFFFPLLIFLEGQKPSGRRGVLHSSGARCKDAYRGWWGLRSEGARAGAAAQLGNEDAPRNFYQVSLSTAAPRDDTREFFKYLSSVFCSPKVPADVSGCVFVRHCCTPRGMGYVLPPGLGFFIYFFIFEASSCLFLAAACVSASGANGISSSAH